MPPLKNHFIQIIPAFRMVVKKEAHLMALDLADALM